MMISEGICGVEPVDELEISEQTIYLCETFEEKY
jgi:hypothetical protein